MYYLYSEIKSKIKTGDLVAWDSPKYSSLLTFILFLYQKITGAVYTHVGVVVKIGGRLYVVEAVPPMVRIFPLENQKRFYWIDATVKGSASRQLGFLTARVGKPYSILDMFKIFLGMENSKEDYYCSELAADFYLHFGYITDPEAGYSPDTIVKAISEREGVDVIKVLMDKGNVK